MANTPEERISRLESKTSDYERRLKFQEEKNEQLNEISTYVRLQYEHNKRQDEKIEELFEKISKTNEDGIDRMEKINVKYYNKFEQLTKVLDGINTSLLGMNHDIKYVKDRQDATDGKIEGLEEMKIKEEEELLKGLQDARKERRNMFVKIVVGVVTTVMGALILLWLGLN